MANENLNCCLNCKNWIYNKYVLQGYDKKYKMCNIASETKSNGMMNAICSSEGIDGELITREDFGCILFDAN